VTCDDARSTLSAALDGEASLEERQVAAAHLASCPDCREWLEAAARIHRLVRVQAAEPMPNLTSTILARAHPPEVGRGEWTRTALAVVALTEIVLAVPALFGHDTGASIHLARHIGALTAALALGYLYAAWRPIRAYGLLPIAGALAALSTFTALLDMLQGRVAMLGESTHVLDLAALTLLWMLAGRPGWSGRTRRSSRRRSVATL
jgi:predicted anti-sigma-YlaC factor YlaD